jgi:excinuclease ABC subunit C
MMKAHENLIAQIKSAPDEPGVYLFQDAGGEVLYVGKAASLRKRLTSYLPAARGRGAGRLPAKVVDMVEKAEQVEWIAVSTEVEALILEDNLIKRHRPAFNIRLRDDKSYPYIVITMEEEYPRVMFTRQRHTRGNLYFGPYANAAKVRETLDVLGRIFPFRKCKAGRPGRRSGAPCLQHAIKRCEAPCGRLMSPEEYRGLIQQVIDFLSGKERQIARHLQHEMKAAARAQEFEKAALYRDRLDAVRHILEKQRARLEAGANLDVIGLAMDGLLANVQVFLTRDGVLADRRAFTLENTEGATEEEVFERFFAEYYAGALTVPPEIIVPSFVADTDRLARFLSEIRPARTTVRRAERGDKRRLLEMAERNAALGLEHERLRSQRSSERRYGAMERLQELLGLPRPPLRIEGYDVSNLGQENIVASMIVFQGGVPRKADYRRFTITGTEGQDDFAAMAEALRRRLRRARSLDGEDYDPSFEAVPDLIVVDGGKGQLNVAIGALEEAGLAGVVPVISLAKKEEEVFLPGEPEPLRLARDDAALHLLQRLRDEAHRFAVTFHRTRRRSGATRSILDALPGVGERRRRAILQHFGSPERFLTASREELEAVPGLPCKVARDIYDYVHKTG